MHDYLCQHILGAAFAVKALAGDLDREGSRHAGQLHDLARLVNEAVTQVRDISRGLHPVELESGGLPAALQGLASPGQPHSALRIPAAMKMRPSTAPIPPCTPIASPRKP